MCIYQVIVCGVYLLRGKILIRHQPRVYSRVYDIGSGRFAMVGGEGVKGRGREGQFVERENRRAKTLTYIAGKILLL